MTATLGNQVRIATKTGIILQKRLPSHSTHFVPTLGNEGTQPGCCSITHVHTGMSALDSVPREIASALCAVLDAIFPNPTMVEMQRTILAVPPELKQWIRSWGGRL